MAAKKSNLKTTEVTAPTLKLIERPKEEQAIYCAEYERWEKAEASWRISETELRRRVADIREELEWQRDQLEAVPFELPADCIPASLDRKRKELVQDFITVNPVIDGFFKMIDDYARQHGCHKFLDFNAKLFELKWQSAETGFKIGVLAGAIFSGCSKNQIDRLERGLAFSLMSNSQIAKEDDD